MPDGQCCNWVCRVSRHPCGHTPPQAFQAALDSLRVTSDQLLGPGSTDLLLYHVLPQVLQLVDVPETDTPYATSS